MNNFETFNALLSLVNTVRKCLNRRASGMNGSKSRIQGINKIDSSDYELGDASVQVCPMAITISVGLLICG
jgi:hypothetical protein